MGVEEGARAPLQPDRTRAPTHGRRPPPGGAPEKSNRKIAAEMGVHKNTVESVRSHLQSTGQIAQLSKTVGAGADAPAAAVGCRDQPHGTDARLGRVARADRREDRLAAGQRDAMERDLLGSRPGTRRGARGPRWPCICRFLRRDIDYFAPLPVRRHRHRERAKRRSGVPA